VAEVDVRRRRVDPELDAQRPTLGASESELGGKPARRQAVDPPSAQPGRRVARPIGPFDRLLAGAWTRIFGHPPEC
jgi:hypothetical protein